MKILVLTGFWPTNQNLINGIFVKHQVEEFVRQGHIVTVIAPIVLNSLEKHREFHTNYPGFEVWSPRIFVPLGIRFMPKVLRICAIDWSIRSLANSVLKLFEKGRISHEFDVLQIHGLVFCGLALPLLKRTFTQPSTITVHGKDNLLGTVSQESRLNNNIVEMWNCVSRVVPVGSALEDYLSFLKAPSEKLHVILNGTKRVSYDTKITGDLSDRNTINIISISNLVKSKKIDLNIKALSDVIRSVPNIDIKYTVVGDGPERHELEKLARNKGLTSVIQFVGRLSHSETMQMLQQADIFSLPSHEEAFGIVFIEAMMRGKPVIACRETGAEESVRDGINGYLIEKENQSELASRMRTLITDTEIRRHMGDAARETSRNFSLERNVAEYIDLFQIICRE